MAGTTVEWLAFFLFIFLFVGSAFAEVQWLVRKGWTTSGRATGFVITADIVAFVIGGSVVFAAVLVLFIMVMGPAGRGGTSPESLYWLVSAMAAIFPFLILFLTKRLFLGIFKIGGGASAWLYSLLSSILIIVVVFVPPPLLLYLIVTLWK